MTGLYPLRFSPAYKDYVWGGDKIIRRFNRPSAGLSRYAESWEISDRPEGMSVVSAGPLAARTLADLTASYGEQLIGRPAAAGIFPLLVKIIDARETLSVQVHPDDEGAARHGGDAKSEMWYVLQADPGAALYYGFNGNVQRADFEAAVRDHNVPELLRKIPVTAGDAVYVPGGCVHAIGAGCLLLEIQQNSNTTYRIYDWDRPGPDGKPRDLHLDQAMKIIHWGRLEVQQPDRSPYFRFKTFRVNGCVEERMDGSSFHVLFVEQGRLNVGDATIAAGTSLLLPAAIGSVALEGDARVCRIALP